MNTEPRMLQPPTDARTFDVYGRLLNDREGFGLIDFALMAPMLAFLMLGGIETGRYVVRATNTGVSAAIDPSGRLILRLPSFEVAHGQATVRMMGGHTPYLRLRDGPAVAVAVVLVVLGAVLGRRR